MTKEEQNVFLSKEHAEAVRYLDNAKESLQKAKKNDHGFYTDKKYVRTACGTAYSGVLVALDAWLTLKGVENPKKHGWKSADFYKTNLSRLDEMTGNYYDTVHSCLYLFGYYDGCLDTGTIQTGFRRAYEIIEKIKPEHPVEVKESRADRLKMAFSILLISTAAMFR